MHPFYIVTYIKHYAGEYVEYKRETYCQKRGVDEKQSYFIGGNIEPAPKVSAYPKRVTFEKCENPLQHINLYFSVYSIAALPGTCKLKKWLQAL